MTNFTIPPTTIVIDSHFVHYGYTSDSASEKWWSRSDGGLPPNSSNDRPTAVMAVATAVMAVATTVMAVATAVMAVATTVMAVATAVMAVATTVMAVATTVKRSVIKWRTGIRAPLVRLCQSFIRAL